eukprot:TRINITY_DN16044_c0_g1_i1.p1 TRINITY_DN16044_c0_g1~~TRINITY_DN16044_c0_g1_i1.p1  ORF type:complete len:534 (+),score=195.07 TRINITY_DN16044_c0_g1_i1:67-1668(+)
MASTQAVFLLAAAALLSGAAARRAYQKKPSSAPSIIFILSDDLGYGDYEGSDGTFPVTPQGGAGRLSTPHIDRMAKNGMRFLQSYSGPICAPSRSTLMTGRHMGHTTIRGNDGSYSALQPDDPGVAKVLQETHVTALFGKWGLGDVNTTGAPLAQGYDVFFGQDTQVGCHNWYPDGLVGRLMDGNAPHPVPENKDATFATCGPKIEKCKWSNDMYGEAAVEFIHAHHDVPFFIYLSTTTPHEGYLGSASGGQVNPVPWPVMGEFAGKPWPERERNFTAAVTAQDNVVGDVLDAVDAAGIAERTVIFFAGDNGPAPGQHDTHFYDSNGPFAGWKTSVMEGGIRQTVVVQWKGTVPAGAVNRDHIFAFWDFLPTAADIAGAPLPAGIDGLSAYSALTDPNAVAPENRMLYYEFCWTGVLNTQAKVDATYGLEGERPIVYGDGWTQAVRLGDWKMYRTNQDNTTTKLFNVSLAGDYAETTDVAAQHPEVVEEIAAVMAREHSDSAFWPAATPENPTCCSNCYARTGCAAPCLNPVA